MCGLFLSVVWRINPLNKLREMCPCIFDIVRTTRQESGLAVRGLSFYRCFVPGERAVIDEKSGTRHETSAVCWYLLLKAEYGHTAEKHARFPIVVFVCPSNGKAKFPHLVDPLWTCRPGKSIQIASAWSSVYKHGLHQIFFLSPRRLEQRVCENSDDGYFLSHNDWNSFWLVEARTCISFASVVSHLLCYYGYIRQLN